MSMKKIMKFNGSATSFIRSHKINFEEKKTLSFVDRLCLYT